MNKYQKILNLLAINSNSEYRSDSRGRANYRIKIEGNDTIVFYEGDHEKPDSKKVVDFKKGTYVTYENVNWNQQDKPVKWQVFRKFLILDFNHILDGLSECPDDLERNPYINKQDKDTKETAYVQFLFKKPNESLINGMRRVWINSKKDVKKQIFEAAKLINGYPKYWITDKEVKANIEAFNKAKTFNFKTKFNLYVTTNEHFFNVLAPKEFFEPWKQILKELGFNYTWKEYKGDEIFKFDQEKNSLYFMVKVLNNWYLRGALNEKQEKFYKTVPPIAKEFPFLVTPDKKIIDEINDNADKEAKKLNCDITDRRLLDIVSKLLNPKYRYSQFKIYFSRDALFMCASCEEYNSKTKKWEKGLGGFSITPVTPKHVPIFAITVFADLIALSNHPQQEELIQKLVTLVSNFEVDKEHEEEKDVTLQFLKTMLDEDHSYFNMYFKINKPEFKNKVFYVNRMPAGIFESYVDKKYEKYFESLDESKVDKSKVIYLSRISLADYFKK